MVIFIKRGICYLLLMLFFNFTLLLSVLPGTAAILITGTVLTVFYIIYNFIPLKNQSLQRRIRILNGGYELMLASTLCFTLEVLVYLYLVMKGAGIPIHILIINGLFCTCLLFILLFNGIVRIFTCSGQLGIMPRICLLLFWWMPVVNLILLRKFLSVSHREYEFTVKKQQLHADRKNEELCRTRYPIMMVHGIFFRDWKNFNYWGRIPKELMDNGGVIFYSNHQSSASVEECAVEIKQSILDYAEKTGCEKINIIAHSKGGLDCRYAISCLGMDQYVASLTTINTPHMGCNYVHRILKRIPQKTISAIGNKYESLYRKLGDDNPDFFSGLKDLTDKECARLNRIMKDSPDVLYQSIGSQMHSHSSAIFPLNLGYCMIKYFGGGDNDGLVPVNSMTWGDFYGILKPKGQQGISHGDVIDLTRKNIEGFDVCEFYVDLVNKLKVKEL